MLLAFIDKRIAKC